MPDLSVPFNISYAALWILVVFQGLVLLGLVRVAHHVPQNGEQVAQPHAGTIAPQFNALDLRGSLIRSDEFVGHVTALLFVSPNCRSCSLTLAEMEALQFKTQGNVIVVCRANREDCQRLGDRYDLTVPAIADEDDHISRLFGISSVPTAVLIDANGRIQSYGQPMRAEELEEMLEGEPVQQVQRTA